MPVKKIKLSPHQQRVIAAMLALEIKFGCKWWDREQIGIVVGAGGFHRVLQVATMGKLKERGLVKTERSSWPDIVRTHIRCNCACHYWGLTREGLALASRLKIQWTDEALERLNQVGHYDGQPLDEDDQAKAMRDWMDRHNEDYFNDTDPGEV